MQAAHLFAPPPVPSADVETEDNVQTLLGRSDPIVKMAPEPILPEASSHVPHRLPQLDPSQVHNIEPASEDTAAESDQLNVSSQRPLNNQHDGSSNASDLRALPPTIDESDAAPSDAPPAPDLNAQKLNQATESGSSQSVDQDPITDEPVPGDVVERHEEANLRRLPEVDGPCKNVAAGDPAGAEATQDELAQNSLAVESGSPIKGLDGLARDDAVPDTAPPRQVEPDSSVLESMPPEPVASDAVAPESMIPEPASGEETGLEDARLQRLPPIDDNPSNDTPAGELGSSVWQDTSANIEAAPSIKSPAADVQPPQPVESDEMATTDTTTDTRSPSGGDAELAQDEFPALEAPATEQAAAEPSADNRSDDLASMTGDESAAEAGRRHDEVPAVSGPWYVPREQEPTTMTPPAPMVKPDRVDAQEPAVHPAPMVPADRGGEEGQNDEVSGEDELRQLPPVEDAESAVADETHEHARNWHHPYFRRRIRSRSRSCWAEGVNSYCRMKWAMMRLRMCQARHPPWLRTAMRYPWATLSGSGPPRWVSRGERDVAWRPLLPTGPVLHRSGNRSLCRSYLNRLPARCWSSRTM